MEAEQILKNIPKRTTKAFNKKIYLLGIDKNNEKIWLEEPTWDCDWYWGFGYIQRYTNNTCPEKAKDITSHSHWDGEITGFKDEKNNYVHHINGNPNLIATTLTDNESWELSDLMKSFYTLKNTAEIFRSGMSHIAKTKVNLKDKKQEDHINKVLLFKIFKRIDEILSNKEVLK